MNKQKKNYIFASLFTGVYDVNRNEILESDHFDYIKNWYQSIIRLKLHAVIFHNTFSKATVAQYQNEFINFKWVEFSGGLNANIFRYEVYKQYLDTNAAHIANVFATDITDVVVLNDPFTQPLFLKNPTALFCGDEPKILDNEWMYNHCTHFRNTVPGFTKYELENKEKSLLNCGIIGGSLPVIANMMNNLAFVHATYSNTNTTAYTLDMGAFNFVARTQFTKTILHGPPINTLFKQYQTERTDCWFRHK